MLLPLGNSVKPLNVDESGKTIHAMLSAFHRSTGQYHDMAHAESWQAMQCGLATQISSLKSHTFFYPAVACHKGPRQASVFRTILQLACFSFGFYLSLKLNLKTT